MSLFEKERTINMHLNLCCGEKSGSKTFIDAKCKKKEKEKVSYLEALVIFLVAGHRFSVEN